MSNRINITVDATTASEVTDKLDKAIVTAAPESRKELEDLYSDLADFSVSVSIDDLDDDVIEAIEEGIEPKRALELALAWLEDNLVHLNDFNFAAEVYGFKLEETIKRRTA